ncbi:MAG TPA: antitoxin VapB family protein [Candidatus Nanoarchaeia archaeon]|nr:antitoxin VapB family protein [Candidatus Nanoarchaeia archaeon]
MTTKTITITEDAYTSITSLKSEEESFSNLFIRLAREKSGAEKYLGILKGDVHRARIKTERIREDISRDFKKRENVLFRHQRSA